MDELTGDAQARLFEQHRAQLRAIAYRMLGSVGDAEDAVQEAWFRLNRADADVIDNMAAWLTTVVGRICIDMLRARSSRREDYVGTQLPEPVVEDENRSDPEKHALIADSVGLALLVVLDTLSPAERLSFVLHDMFGIAYEEIAPIVDRSPDAARQLASRARRRVRGAPAHSEGDLVRQREVVDAFLAATRQGDFAALVQVLDPEVTFRVDPGSMAWVGLTDVHGVDAVANRALTHGRRFAAFCRPALINGSIGIVAQTAKRIIGVAALTVIDGRIVEIDLVLDPKKLERAAH
jgi:RNA polymerase sigma factor (sigma-70 family)